MILPDLTARRAALLAGAASALLLVAALGFQAAGYVPCELCILQRWPHLAAAGLAAVVLFAGFRRIWALLGLLAAAVATGLALYHAGVELHWWAGPSACAGGLGDLGGISAAQLVSTGRFITFERASRCADASTIFSSAMIAGPTPSTCPSWAGSAEITRLKSPNRSSSLRASGFMSCRGTARNRISSSSS